MWPASRREHDALSRYWNALVRGARAEELVRLAEPLDPELVATIARVRARRRLRPDPNFVNGLEGDLMQAIVGAQPGTIPLRPERVAPSNGSVPPRTGWRPPFARPAAWSDVRAYLATALLVGITLVATYFAFAERPQRAVVPPSLGSPLADTPPPPGVVLERVLEATVADLPGGVTQVELDLWTLHPGPATLNVPPLGGALLLALEAGSATAAVAGTDRLLAADTPLVVPADTAVTVRNTGPTDAVVLLVALTRSLPSIGPGALTSSDPAAVKQELVIYSSTDALPAGAARVVVERLTLPPGAALPSYTATGRDWVGIETGTLGLTLEGPRVLYPMQSGVERPFVLGQEPPGFGAGTRVTLRNTGETPLALLRLTLTPVGPSGGAGTPAP